jgi:two-component system, NtrC family, sensor kinase
MREQDGYVERIRALEQRLAEVSRQQAATAEVLHVIGESGADLDRVFDTVVRNAATLSGADAGQIWHLDGDVYRIARAFGGSDAYNEYLRGVVLRPAKDTVVGKVALEHRSIQLPDVLADSDYWFPEGQRLGGFRTLLGVPMMHGGIAGGVLIVWRHEIDVFDESQIELVETFAAQGTIAILNAELFAKLNESASRSRSPISRTSRARKRSKTSLTSGCSRRRRSNSGLWIAYVSASSRAATVAERRSSSPSSASSPKLSPAPRTATVATCPRGVMTRIANRPLAIRWTESPGSPL